MQTPYRGIEVGQLQGPPEVTLYSTQGYVHSIRGFAEKALDVLAPHEQQLVRSSIPSLAGADEIPFHVPLVRTQRLADGRVEVPARRAGARSALLPERGLKIKACRPERASFPKWVLDEQLQLEVQRVPFGVLGAEEVMREILATCFLKGHGLPRASRPVAVFEYELSNGPAYAVVSSYEAEERVEARFDSGGLTLHRIMRLRRAGDRLGLLGREMELRGMDRAAYVQKKVGLLAGLHVAGGFRGVLNSNIGNDVVRENQLVALCDFDTFSVKERPAPEDEAAIRRFVVQAILETVKSSLPFVDYIDVEGKTRLEAHQVLAAYYRRRSSVFREYVVALCQHANASGWSQSLVEEAIEGVFSLDVTFELLQELIPNGLTFSNFSTQSVYVPHG